MDIALALACVSPILGTYLTATVDGGSRSVSTQGVVTGTVYGNVGGVVSVGLFGAATLLALFSTIGADSDRGCAEGQRPIAIYPLVGLVCWWGICSIVLRRDSVDVAQAPYTVCALVLFAAALRTSPSVHALRALNVVRDMTSISLLYVGLADPAIGQQPCSEDKCGVFGTLITGYFPNANSAAETIVLLTPALLISRTRIYVLVSGGLSLFAVLATGSRTSAIDTVVVLLFVVAYRRKAPIAAPTKVWLVWRLVPLSFFCASLWAYLSFSGPELTGRGYIYAGIRGLAHGYALIFGSGPSTMSTLFETGAVAFDVSGEHGVVPHLVVEGGLLAPVLFASSMIGLAVSVRRWSASSLAAFGLLLAASLEFVTEPGWMLSARTVNFVSLVIFVGMFRVVSSDRAVGGTASEGDVIIPGPEGHVSKRERIADSRGSLGRESRSAKESHVE